MKRPLSMFFAFLFFLCFLATPAFPHCEIPCGIYDDEARIGTINEHIATIEKSMQQILKLEGEENINFNQLVRWITNKEDHANQLQDIVAQYFLTQRVKIDADDYERKLALLHQMLVRSMYCKQTTELDHVKELRTLVAEFNALYFGEKAE